MLWEVALLCMFFISTMEETIRICLEELVDIGFVELFKAHLLEKKIKIISFVCADIFIKQMMLQSLCDTRYIRFYCTSSQLISLFGIVEIHLFYFHKSILDIVCFL